MKCRTTFTLGVLLLVGTGAPIQAQVGTPAVRMTVPGPANAVSFTLKNLAAGPLAVDRVELQIFSQGGCHPPCRAVLPFKKSIDSCKTTEGTIRCTESHLPQPARYIYLLRVYDAGGKVLTEDWLYKP